MHSYSKPILGMSTIRSARFVALLHNYGDELVRAGYHPVAARLHLQSIVHFGVWLDRKGLQIEKIDDRTVAAFARHRARCRCPRVSQNQAGQVPSRVRVFVRHLRERGCVAAAEVVQPDPIDPPASKVAPGQSIQFSATIPGVGWRVTGTPGATISATGM